MGLAPRGWLCVQKVPTAKLENRKWAEPKPEERKAKLENRKWVKRRGWGCE